MTKPIRTEGTTKLQEGLYFRFMLRSVVTLQDQKQYYILEDPDGMKHFLENEPYIHYYLKPGTHIRCQVVKINCTGRVILEPEHPHFQSGRIYRFRLLNYDDGKDYLNLEDKSGHILKCPIEGDLVDQLSRQVWVQCRINGIQKGVVELQILNEK